MKIGFDGRFITHQASGNGVFTRCLLESLVGNDKNNQYIAYLAYENSLEARDNLELRKMPFFHRNPYLRILATLPIELSRRPVDIFHAFYSIPVWVPAKIVLTLVEFFWATNPERLPLSNFFQAQLCMMTKYAVTHADVIIVPTYFVRDRLLNYIRIPEERVYMIPLGLNDYFLGEPNPQEIQEVKSKYNLNKPYILTVGDIHKRKNFTALIDVFARLKEKTGLSHRLIIAGKLFKKSQALQSKIAASKFREDIFVIGFVPISHLRVLYRNADLFVLPSLDEGFGLITHEAMASHTPVVCSNRGALPEVVGDAAVLFNPCDQEEMEHAIVRAIEDSDLREDLIQRGLKRIRHFSWKNIALATLDIYSKLL